jgi:hypothetical protein
MRQRQEKLNFRMRMKKCSSMRKHVARLPLGSTIMTSLAAVDRSPSVVINKRLVGRSA